jgi:hypothetical protein
MDELDPTPVTVEAVIPILNPCIYTYSPHTPPMGISSHKHLRKVQWGGAGTF